MNEERITLTVAITKGETEWVAECVEYELAAQGPSEESAFKSFTRVLTAQLMLDGIKGRAPLEGIEKDQRPMCTHSVGWASHRQERQLGSPSLAISDLFNSRS